MATATTRSINALLAIRNGLLTGRWNFTKAVNTPLTNPAGIGQGVALTYSFPASLPPYFSPAQIPGFQMMNATEKVATRRALAYFSSIMAIRFQEQPGIGQLTFALSSQSGSQGGFAYNPTFGYTFANGLILSVQELEAAGDVWLNGELNRAPGDWQPNGSGYATLLHEIGHALGLKHPFEAPSDGFLLDPALDNERYTVMSYNPAANTDIITVDPSDGSYTYIPIRPSTLMPLDIQALQYLYGPRLKTRHSDTTYSWAQDAEILETIYDTGGQDTISGANQRLGCLIDLRPGAYSSIAIRRTDSEKRSALELPASFTAPLPASTYDGRDNLAIAQGVTIENALGGDGADVLIGNRVANILNGGRGRDQLTGGLGGDHFVFDRAPQAANRDRLRDFEPGQDRIVLDATVFSRLSGSAAGTPLNPQWFHIGPAPADNDDHLLFNPASHLLSYAPDGQASTTLLPICQIAFGSIQPFSAADILVVS
jgi:hypothetical protein